MSKPLRQHKMKPWQHNVDRQPFCKQIVSTAVNQFKSIKEATRSALQPAAEGYDNNVHMDGIPVLIITHKHA